MSDLDKKNEITFKLCLQGVTNYSDLEECVFEFFDDIKSEVHERFLESQKKYFKIEDGFYLIHRDYTQEFYKSRAILINHGLLEGDREVDLEKLDDELLEHFRVLAQCFHSFSEISVSHGNIPIKDFNEYYDYQTRELYYDAIRWSKNDFTICIIELYFTFTNSCNCDIFYENEGCNCNALHYVNDENVNDENI